MRTLSMTALARWAVSLAMAFLITHSAQAGEARKRPNIIFILADDLGYGDLGCYGQKKIKTPHLDRLAARGMRFTQAYAGSTVCAPSRCALMTGQHTGHCLVRGNGLVPLRPEDVTVARLLQQGGYTTGLIGKWGLGEPGTSGVPGKQGFDYFFGFLNQHHAHNYYPDYLWRNDEKVPLKDNVQVKDNIAGKKTTYAHDLFTQEALAFVEKNKARPFFLYLAYTIPHANNERGRAEGNGMEVPSDEPYSKEPWPQVNKNHAAMITRMDRDIGKLLDRLRELGLEEDTIIFFSSDNGPHREGGADPTFFLSSGPLRGFKRSLHEGGVRVPMIVCWPGKVRPGSVNDHVWAFWDFLPTAAELAGVATPKGGDGISIVPTLLGKGKQRQHEYLYWEFHEGGFQQAVRSGDWKGVRKKQGMALELYNLRTDLGEKTNIAAQHPEVVARIQAYLKGARTESPHWPKGMKKKK
ncbi:MAG: arylsulfatase [Gemmataceae bacterium]|nr:arylsulfatase [Gemmataceae bacterium]